MRGGENKAMRGCEDDIYRLKKNALLPPNPLPIPLTLPGEKNRFILVKCFDKTLILK